MNLSDYIDRERILLSLSSNDKESAIAEMVCFLDAKNAVADPERAIDALIERERLGSTALGEMAAVPHAKLVIEKPVILLAVSDGIDFDSPDGEDVRLFFLLLAPEKEINLHLKILSRISRLIKMTDFKERVLKATNIDEICSILKEEESKL